MTIHSYKCLSCGGNLEWSPSRQKLHCSHCESDYDRLQYEAEGEENVEVRIEDLRTYRCSSCGAEVLADPTTAATSCAFCGSPVLLAENLTGAFHPRWIIPFQIERGDVREIYRSYVKTRPFAPGCFLSQAQLDKIQGVYVPFWTYDIGMQGYLHARGERLRTWSDSRYTYTEHSVYDIQRAGHMKLDRIPVDASSRMADDMMDSVEPFLFEKLTDFHRAYMLGFLAERYDEDSDTCYDRARKRASETMRGELRRTIGAYSGLQTLDERVSDLTDRGEEIRADYAMLPVYLLAARYKDKIYRIAINGQTGKAVGEIPIDKGRSALFIGLTFIISFAVILIILNFIW